jgi:hypothetical protein
MPKEFTLGEMFTYKCDVKNISKSFTTEKERDQYKKRHWKFCTCHNYQYVFDETTYFNTQKSVIKELK